MYKKIIIPRSLDQIETLKNSIDGFIVGIKEYSVNLPLYLDIEEIKNLKEKYSDKEIFVCLNKNYHNKDIINIKKYLKDLELLNINGVIYYDVALINLKEEMKLDIDLVYSQEHSVTNYETINYWNSKGAKYAYLSNELTLHEIEEIARNSKSKIFVSVLGYIPIFVSERMLITNYLNKFLIEDNTQSYKIYKENKMYRIVEKNDVTEVYSNYILNTFNEIKKVNNIEYMVFNSFDIEEESFNDIINNIHKYNDDEIENILKNTDKGFLYKETIYKVKNYDKS